LNDFSTRPPNLYSLAALRTPAAVCTLPPLTLEEEGEVEEGPLEFGEDVGVRRWVRGDGSGRGEDPAAGEAARGGAPQD
jgi:hypothetical protein